MDVRPHLSPLAEVLALVAMTALLPMDLVGPSSGLQTAALTHDDLEAACFTPACTFRVSSRRLQRADRRGCATATSMDHADWAATLAALRDDFDHASACLLFVDDDAPVQEVVRLLDVAIGAGFPSVSVALDSPCRAGAHP
ncbi:MAG: hypothetical protein SFW67_21705 [Myxococcaceae bacterium]|nr:hypothetical protein [Myxococcaceae bacterium]